MFHLLLVTGVANVEDLRAVVHQVGPAVEGHCLTLALKACDFKLLTEKKMCYCCVFSDL